MKEEIRTGIIPETAGSDPMSRVMYVDPAISWKGIFAGAFVGMLTYLALGALGVAFGAIGLEQAIEAGGGGVALTVGAGIWLLLIAIAALFVGGYVAARASGVIPTRIGAIEGLVVAGLFFVLMLTGVGAGLGAVARGTGSLVGAIGSGAANVAQSQQVQSVVQQSLAGLDLRAEPGVVVQNVAVRLVRGDEQGAVAYLAQQTGISTAEAQRRLDQIKGQVAATARDVGQTAAQATQIAGWFLFGMILLGAAGALFGGALGARRNISRPVSDRDRRMAIESRDKWTVPAYYREEPVTRPT